MTIKLGEKIKNLRRERDMTQEQLAEVLGVSYQAISKWETNATLPDVTLFPIIAQYFNVTTDELFGMAELRDEARLEEATKRLFENGMPPPTEETVAEWRQLAREFPRNLNVHRTFADVLFRYGSFESKMGFQRESIAVFESLHEKLSDAERPNNITIISNGYAQIGELDKALAWVNKLTPAQQCREEAIGNVYMMGNAPTLMEHLRNNINLYNAMLSNAIGAVVSRFPMNMEFFTRAQLIALVKIRIESEAVRKILYPETPQGNDWGVAHCYRDLAELYAPERTDDVLDCAEKIAELAIAATAVLGEFDGGSMTTRNEDGTRTVTQQAPFTPRDIALEWFDENACFDCVRKEPRFLAARERLKGE